MRKLVAVLALVTMLVTAWLPGAAHAGGSTDAALALAAFAVFNQLFLAPFYYGAYAQPSYAAPPAVYSAPAVAYAATPQPPAIVREVRHPNGRYVLYGDGVTVAYEWVWLPNAPIPPPPAGAPPGPPPR